MTPAPMRSRFALCVALSVLLAGAGVAWPAPPSVEELKRAVEQREQDLHAAQIALTMARVRLARAEGKANVAARECRTLLREYEARLKVVQGRLAQGRLCSEEALRQAEGSVAVARAWLADAENDRKVLLTELPKVIAYHEWRIQWYKSLRESEAIPEEVAAEAVKESETDLQWARDRLARFRGKAAGKDKAGQADKRGKGNKTKAKQRWLN